jgi:hypothetical protein
MNWTWVPLLLTAISVAGLVLGWPLEYTVPALVIIFAVGLTTIIIGYRKNQLELASLKLSQLAVYFARRFTGNSPISIFAIIEGVFNIDNPRLWDWARACYSSQRILSDWCNSFVTRIEGDVRSRKSASHLGNHLNELWLINGHYFEFIEQLYEVGQSFEFTRELTDQYGRFVMEYNAFVQDFRENISELRKVVKTAIDPPSVKMARELRITVQRQS